MYGKWPRRKKGDVHRYFFEICAHARGSTHVMLKSRAHAHEGPLLSIDITWWAWPLCHGKQNATAFLFAFLMSEWHFIWREPPFSACS
jgi:hypothetical protein